MNHRVRRALWALTLASACSCGLDRGGLLDVENEDDGSSGDSGVDATSTGDGSNESGAGADAPDGAFVSGQDGADVEEQAPADAGTGDEPDASTVDAPIGDAASVTVVRATPILWDGGPIADPDLNDTNWTAFCVALVACGEMPSVSACVGLLPQPASRDVLIPTTEMVNNVGIVEPDCAQVAAAIGGGQACPSSTPDACEGNSLVTCRWGFGMKVDCGELGLVCSRGDGNAGCGFGDCAASQEGKTYCVGSNYVAVCSSGRYEPAVDCETFGGGCAGPQGTAGCVGTGGASCTGGGGSCADTTLTECADGVLGSVDCSPFYNANFACFVNGGGAAFCAAGQSCDPLATDTCGGQGMTKVNFCNAGLDDTYDCTENGYSGCDGGKCYP